MSTKSPKSDKQYVWESVADSSSYVIREETDPENFLTPWNSNNSVSNGTFLYSAVLSFHALNILRSLDWLFLAAGG